MKWKKKTYEIIFQDEKYRIISGQTKNLLKPEFDTQKEAREYISKTLAKELKGDE